MPRIFILFCALFRGTVPKMAPTHSPTPPLPHSLPCSLCPPCALTGPPGLPLPRDHCPHSPLPENLLPTCLLGWLLRLQQVSASVLLRTAGCPLPLPQHVLFSFRALSLSSKVNSLIFTAHFSYVLPPAPTIRIQHPKRMEKGNGTPLQYSCLENPPWMEEPSRLQSRGSQRVRHD